MTLDSEDPKASAAPRSADDLDDEPRVESEDVAFEALVRRVAWSPPKSFAPEPVPGKSWGDSERYTIVRCVGRGAMGTVYEARDQLLGRPVALKVLHANDADSEANRVRIVQEARLAAKLNHDRIARVYDLGKHEGTSFVAMEYVSGTTLRSLIVKGKVSPYYALTLTIGIAEALAELHDRNVVHRDLKPENVMLSKDSGVKLLDFGLARQRASSGDEAAAPVGHHGVDPAHARPRGPDVVTLCVFSAEARAALREALDEVARA